MPIPRSDCFHIPLAIVCIAVGCGKPVETRAPASENQAQVPRDDGGKAGTDRPENRAENSGPDGTAPSIENSLRMKFALIPAGEFLMGAPDTDIKARAEEKPQHLVQISQPFYMAVYEVTHADYELLMKRNPSLFTPNGLFADRVAGEDNGRLPVTNVTWDDAVEFCRLLSALPAEQAAGRVYRLPTEAEWEYACRAGTRTKYSWGDTIEPENAAFDHTDVGAPFLGHPKKVGSYAANGFGLYDMHGNAAEWCQDYFDFDYYGRSPIQDPVNSQRGKMPHRVLRGGDYHAHPIILRSSRREADVPRTRTSNGGIRVVLVASSKANHAKDR